MKISSLTIYTTYLLLATCLQAEDSFFDNSGFESQVLVRRDAATDADLLSVKGSVAVDDVEFGNKLQ